MCLLSIYFYFESWCFVPNILILPTSNLRRELQQRQNILFQSSSLTIANLDYSKYVYNTIMKKHWSLPTQEDNANMQFSSTNLLKLWEWVIHIVPKYISKVPDDKKKSNRGKLWTCELRYHVKHLCQGPSWCLHHCIRL